MYQVWLKYDYEHTFTVQPQWVGRANSHRYAACVAGFDHNKKSPARDGSYGMAAKVCLAGEAPRYFRLKPIVTYEAIQLEAPGPVNYEKVQADYAESRKNYGSTLVVYSPEYQAQLRALQVDEEEGEAI